jgi:hypothetical protein
VPYSFFTVIGIAVVIGGISALFDGSVATGRLGIVAGLATVVFSEWSRWRAKLPPT